MKEIKLTDKMIIDLYNRFIKERGVDKVIIQTLPTQGIFLDNDFYSLNSLIKATNERLEKSNVRLV